MSLLRKIQIFSSNVAKLWTIDEANTSRTTSTVVGAVQIVDASGKVPPAGEAVGNAPFVKLTDGTNTAAIDAANTARTTGTKVQAVQNVDATGKVSPAGDTLANAPYAKVTMYNSSGTEMFTATNPNQTSLVDKYGFIVENTPQDEMRVVIPTRLIGTNFDTTKDTNFWTETVANNGSVTLSYNELSLNTNTTSANGSAVYQTARKGRYVSGTSMKWRAILKTDNSGVTNNSRKWGVFDGTNGAYWELDGTTMYCVTCKDATPTRVESTNWNVSTTTPTVDNFNSYEIYYTNRKVYFTQGGAMKHIHTITTSTWSNSLTLPCYLSSTNSGGLQTANSLKVLVCSLFRLGQINTLPQYKNITSSTTTICKYGAGHLHHIIVNNPSNNTITIYDNTSATGNKIATIDPDAGAVPFVLDYDCPFYTGLTIVTGGTMDITIVYE